MYDHSWCFPDFDAYMKRTQMSERQKLFTWVMNVEKDLKNLVNTTPL